MDGLGKGRGSAPMTSFRYGPTFQKNKIKNKCNFFWTFLTKCEVDTLRMGTPLLQKILDLPLLKAPFTLSEIN